MRNMIDSKGVNVSFLTEFGATRFPSTVAPVAKVAIVAYSQFGSVVIEFRKIYDLELKIYRTPPILYPQDCVRRSAVSKLQ